MANPKPMSDVAVLTHAANVVCRAMRVRMEQLGALVYPQTLEGWRFDPTRADEVPLGQVPAQEFVLDLESGRDYSAWAWHEELARGPGFRLLLVGNTPR